MNEAFVAAAKAMFENAAKSALTTFAEQRIDAIRDNIGVPVERQGGRIIRSAQGEFPRMDTRELWLSIKRTDPVSMNGEIDVFIYTDCPHAYWLEVKTPPEGGRPFWSRCYQELVQHGDDLGQLFSENFGSSTPALTT